MSKQDFTAPPFKHDWRHAFRQHALDVDPTIGAEFPTSDAVAPGDHWLLREPFLRSIIVNIAVELRELGRWNGAFANLDNQALLHHAIARIDAVQPVSLLAQVRFTARLVRASLREVISAKRATAHAKRAMRPRAGELGA